MSEEVYFLDFVCMESFVNNEHEGQPHCRARYQSILSHNCRKLILFTFYPLIYFWLQLLGLSGTARLSNPSANIGFIIFFLKYFSVLIPQKSCISFRVHDTIQKSSNPISFMKSSLTSVVPSVLTSVVMPSSGTEADSTVTIAALPKGIIVRKISPYTNCGSAPESSRIYLYVFLMPEPMY